MALRKVGVIGVGLMGSGIAEVLARAGYDTLIREVDDKQLEAGLSRIKASLDRGVDRQKLSSTDAMAALSRIRGTTRLQDLSDSDLVIEAIVESPQQKRELLAFLDGSCKPETILTTNTSSCSVTELMAATRRHDRVAGLHFFNPVPIMKLVEIVSTIATSEATIAELRDLAARTGKTAILAPDRSGFIVNRLLVPYLLDAIRALEDGTGSLDDIDQGMKLGCGHPMGPFELLDMVGLDTTLSIADIMFDEYREPRFAPPPLLRRMVASGRLGRKSGMGFRNHGQS